MKMSKTIVFNEPSSYFSPLDEVIFFQWLELIPSIENIHVDGKGVRITIPDAGFSSTDWDNIIGLLARYEIDMTPLRELADLDPENGKWLKDKRKFWYNAIFGID